MPILWLLRWARGTVHFAVSGGFPERFLNLCRKKGIALWDTQLRGGVLYARVRASDYKTLRSPAKESGMRIRAFRQSGLPFLLLRQRKHAGILVGLAIFVLLIATLSSRVWILTVAGNDATESRIILETLAEQGVRLGARSKTLDIDRLREDTLLELPQLDWIALNRRGSRLEVLVREHAPDPRTPEPTAPADIVAAAEGQLLELRVWAGTPAVPNGSAVQAGDVLIKGETRDGAAVRARGYVVAQTQRRLVTTPVQQLEGKRRHALKKQYALHIFGLRVPLYFRALPEGTESLQLLYVNHTALPLGLETRALPSEETEVRTLSPEQAKLLALADMHAQAAALLVGKEIRGVEATATDDELALTYTLLENIAAVQ
ncbi:MAG: sporulation protein YqfD [Oscillospiraceae bacterium]|jgi:similar to stage IV sporulation protein|nr:sporulation protein YqfD [Oscillospiraceae bacterium]